MKIGLISDIHGNSPALEAIVPVLTNEVDEIFFLGDLCGYYPFVEECVTILSRYSLKGVHGNHDHILLQCYKGKTLLPPNYEVKYGSALRRSLSQISLRTVELLESLPEQLEFRLGGLRFYLGTWGALGSFGRKSLSRFF